MQLIMKRLHIHLVADEKRQKVNQYWIRLQNAAKQTTAERREHSCLWTLHWQTASAAVTTEEEAEEEECKQKQVMKEDLSIKQLLLFFFVSLLHTLKTHEHYTFVCFLYEALCRLRKKKSPGRTNENKN